MWTYNKENPALLVQNPTRSVYCGNIPEPVPNRIFSRIGWDTNLKENPSDDSQVFIAPGRRYRGVNITITMLSVFVVIITSGRRIIA